MKKPPKHFLVLSKPPAFWRDRESMAALFGDPEPWSAEEIVRARKGSGELGYRGGLICLVTEPVKTRNVEPEQATA